MTGTDPALAWAPDDPIRGRMVFVSGVGLPAAVDQLTPALQVYGGGCIPQLRKRLGEHPEYRARVRILCAGHGVVHADTEMLADRGRMTKRRRDQLRPQVKKALLAEFRRDGVPREVLVMAAHPYAGLIDFVFHIPGLLPKSALHSPIPDLTWGWAAAVLDRWGWP